MSIALTPDEQKLRVQIEERVGKVRLALENYGDEAEMGGWIQEAGELAHTLHLSLKKRGREPRHHQYMIRNRDRQPDDPDFYMHFHPLEDLLKFLDDEHANDDPEDQTIDADFTFRVYSRRWGREDTYKVRRTADGWTVRHNVIGGPCDKGGRPFLFHNFRQDSIQYPEGVDEWLERLWNRAAEKGLTKEQVQLALQQLADWVTNTEKNAPAGGVWEGY